MVAPIDLRTGNITAPKGTETTPEPPSGRLESALQQPESSKWLDSSRGRCSGPMHWSHDPKSRSTGQIGERSPAAAGQVGDDVGVAAGSRPYPRRMTRRLALAAAAILLA